MIEQRKITVKAVHKDKFPCALPVCRNALRLCEVMGRDFLTTKDLKVFEVSGFTIVMEDSITHKE